MSDIILESRNLSKSFDELESKVTVFTDINLSIRAGERIAIIGHSGSGKSTLLHLLGGLDNPTSGNVNIKGKDFNSLTEKQRSIARNKSLGFIYQFHHLLPEFTAVENVCMPLLMRKMNIKTAQQKAKAILKDVGLEHRFTHKVAQLSGGERQRVAIARALVTNPDCVLADEPTGNLDRKTADHVFELMLDLNIKMKTSLVIVTHNEELAKRMDKVYVLEDKALTVL